jgi:hypothetical protein
MPELVEADVVGLVQERALGAVQHQRQRASLPGPLDVVVAEPPHAASVTRHRRARARNRSRGSLRAHEVEVLGVTRIEGAVLDPVEREALGRGLGVLRRARLVPVDLLLRAEVERRGVVLAVGGAELAVRVDGLVLEVDDEVLSVGQARPVECVARGPLATHVHPQLAARGVLLALRVRHVSLVEAAGGAGPARRS